MGDKGEGTPGDNATSVVVLHAAVRVDADASDDFEGDRLILSCRRDEHDVPDASVLRTGLCGRRGGDILELAQFPDDDMCFIEIDTERIRTDVQLYLGRIEATQQDETNSEAPELAWTREDARLCC